MATKHVLKNFVSKRLTIDDIRPARSHGGKLKVRPKKFALTRARVLTGICLGLLLIVIILGAIVLSNRHQNTTRTSDINTAIANVARHYVLPANETPALATVTDRDKLNTRFLKQARNGDQVLIYQQNQLAIIYRPNVDRIVAVGPVDISPLPENQQK